jgi:hypothetical protein
LRGRRSPALHALKVPVGLEAGRACLDAGSLKLIGDPVTVTEEHLNRRLAAEG